jgi:hypothetical protein
MSWELRAGSPGLPEELVDGGIADNLPIIPVYRFLFYAGYAGWLTARPRKGEQHFPHLLLTASLEPRKRDIKGDELNGTAACWVTLRRRVKQLQYNVKVDSHRQTQADVAKIIAALEKANLAPGFNMPDVRVSCVQPEWLCDTFAFHPMLGFTRKKQAMSIAHGCASTLVHLVREQNDNLEQTKHWWKTLNLHDAGSDTSLPLKPRAVTPCGDCCFVDGHKCTFARTVLSRIRPAPSEATIVALDEIYQRCGEPQTHMDPEAK